MIASEMFANALESLHVVSRVAYDVRDLFSCTIIVVKHQIGRLVAVQVCYKMHVLAEDRNCVGSSLASVDWIVRVSWRIGRAALVD